MLARLVGPVRCVTASRCNSSLPTRSGRPRRQIKVYTTSEVGLAHGKLKDWRSHLDEDWTHVWPVSRVFDHHVVHLPLRAGAKTFGNEPRPNSISNQELMKVPNFLHLTPKHIEMHIKALKPLCTRWPTSMTESSFPVRFRTYNFLRPGGSTLHPRSHAVEMTVDINAIPLFVEKRQKLLAIVGKRCHPRSQKLVLKSDTLPSRKLNKDHLKYQLLALYSEVAKTEDWEKVPQVPVYDL